MFKKYKDKSVKRQKVIKCLIFLFYLRVEIKNECFNF